jgi:hypothetical protein
MLNNMSFSCADIGKLARITDTVSNSDFASKHPRKHANSHFLVLGGWSEFILPSVCVKGHGAITGLANIAPVSRYESSETSALIQIYFKSYSAVLRNYSTYRKLR